MGILGWEGTPQWEGMERPQACEEAVGRCGQGRCTVNDSSGTLTVLVMSEIYLKSCPWYLDLLLIPHGRKVVKSFTNVWKAFIKLGPN